jgi:hypothetical protein
MIHLTDNDTKCIIGKYKNGNFKKVKISGNAFIKYLRNVYFAPITLSWIIKYDRNFAPCIHGNLLTMWLCKPPGFHTIGKKGDVYVGFASTSTKKMHAKTNPDFDVSKSYISYIIVITSTMDVMDYLKNDTYNKRNDWLKYRPDENGVLKLNKKYKSTCGTPTNRLCLMSNLFVNFKTPILLENCYDDIKINRQGYYFKKSCTGEIAKKLRDAYNLY